MSCVRKVPAQDFGFGQKTVTSHFGYLSATFPRRLTTTALSWRSKRANRIRNIRKSIRFLCNRQCLLFYLCQRCCVRGCRAARKIERWLIERNPVDNSYIYCAFIYLEVTETTLVSEFDPIGHLYNFLKALYIAPRGRTLQQFIIVQIRYVRTGNCSDDSFLRCPWSALLLAAL